MLSVHCSGACAAASIVCAGENQMSDTKNTQKNKNRILCYDNCSLIVFVSFLLVQFLVLQYMRQ